MRVKKLKPTAILPIRNHATDAGVDLYSTEMICLTGMLRVIGEVFDALEESDDIEDCEMKGCTHLFDTGIAMEIPEGCVGMICDKSGRGNNLIKVFGGIIDSGYRDSIKIRLLNLGFGDWFVKPGMALAQLIIVPCSLSTFEDIGDDSLSSSERGIKGFGSQNLRE